MEFNSGGSGGARSSGNDMELLSKTLQVEYKLFYFDLKENPRDRYLKISEKTSATRMQQEIGPQKVGPSMEWKPKPIAQSQWSIKVHVAVVPVEAHTPTIISSASSTNLDS
ncbi:unnamed protein product [Lactuca saligna]|uniref:Uncharacterized protein n=1 Tax=Lactuca saligna TaxID=75948 RepID=A0AA35YRF1_LACSI|nr:unnamed protein product [Lactuca saligna]